MTDKELKWGLCSAAVIVGLGLFGACYCLLVTFPETGREPAGEIISVVKNPNDFLSHETWTVTTSTHCLTTLAPVSARHGARCEIVSTSDGFRWLVVDGHDGRCRIIP